jgi:ATP-dependent Clp protease ATP-binding subunit ClpA
LIKGIIYALINYKEPRRKKAIFAPEIKEILDYAKSKAVKFKDNYIGIDHILLSILSTREEVANFLISLEIDINRAGF